MGLRLIVRESVKKGGQTGEDKRTHHDVATALARGGVVASFEDLDAPPPTADELGETKERMTKEPSVWQGENNDNHNNKRRGQGST